MKDNDPNSFEVNFPDETPAQTQNRLGKEETIDNLIDTLPEAQPKSGALTKDVDGLNSREETRKEVLQKNLLDTAGQPVAQSIIKSVTLKDLDLAQQIELAVQIHERIGKAAGYIPDFASLTENMKGAYLGAVKDVWIAAQRNVRSFE